MLNNLNQDELRELIKFLSINQDLWDKEIIYQYPDYKAPFKDSWIDYLVSLEIGDLYSLLFFEAEGDAPLDLRELIDSIKNFQQTPLAENYGELFPSLAYQFMTEKKRHEVNQIIGYLRDREVLPSELGIIDFCGGAAYLGRSLALYCDSKVLSIDIDDALQKRGEIRAKELSPKSTNLSFTKLNVLENLSTLISSSPRGTSTIGIHTCAHLSDAQIEASRQLESRWIFNVSCCYYKTDDTSYAFSSLSKQSGFKLSKESLLLAARGHDTNYESFTFSISVKKYRYLLHVYTKDVLGLDFIAMGGLSHTDYEKPFHEYAKERLKTVLNLEIPESELKDFSHNQTNLQKVQEMIACNTFRTIFSRLIEKYIALDRAVYLEELGYQVSLLEIFDRKISPRNLAILAIK